MNHIYIVKKGSMNSGSSLQFAFHNLEEAKKFRDYWGRNLGASYLGCTIATLKIYDSAMELIK